MKKKYNRRHFQILEWMIAVFILLMCLPPAMRVYISIYQAQQAVARENHRDHWAHLLHARITEKFYKNEITLGELKPGATVSLSADQLADQLAGQGFQFEAQFRVLHAHIPLKEARPDEYLGKIEITLTDTLNQVSSMQYNYYLYIDAGKEKKQGSSPSPGEPPPKKEADHAPPNKIPDESAGDESDSFGEEEEEEDEEDA